MGIFKLHAPYSPCGDQPKVIQKLVAGLNAGYDQQVLLGVTGSGKTFTMANVIAQMDRPALVISHNKTLAAQLASEFKTFFPENAVEYFVSYYDYYQPEAYVPHTDTYIEKDAAINDQIDRLRHAATYSVLTRRDVIVVASVSCIYGLGSPEDYESLRIFCEVGRIYPRQKLIEDLIRIRYERNPIEFERGHFRVRGDVIDIFPSYEEKVAIRIELYGHEIESITRIDALTGKKISSMTREVIFPASHYVIPEEKMAQAMKMIRQDLSQCLKRFESEGKILEYERLKMRTHYDLEMMREVGYCSGIENYSRYFSGRKEGEAPFTLMDYFADDFLLFIDESHATMPQLRAMYEGDKARKKNLVDHGFRLPSAYDNRPLKFLEFEKYLKYVTYVSATPAEYEYAHSKQVAEQLIRPTGLMDPEISIRPLATQIDDVLHEIHIQIEKGDRTLVTTLTKKMAEDVSQYLKKLNIKAHYLHSDIDTFERLKILKELRRGDVDVIVGVNLLREGLDMPEVSLVAILDADKEGFLRNERSLIQTMGRAARNVNGRVILYADQQTKSIQKAVAETQRRRAIQEAYNKKHNITPQTIQKIVQDLTDTSDFLLGEDSSAKKEDKQQQLYADVLKEDTGSWIMALEDEMKEAAQRLDFEKAAELRDKIKKLSQKF